MPEYNQFGKASPFSNEPLEVKNSQEERPEAETNGRWGTFSGAVPGLVLIIISVLFLLSNYAIWGGEWWQYFLGLLLVVFLIEYWFEYISHVGRRSRLRMGILGILLIVVGIIFLFNPSIWWPLAMLAAGLILIVSYFIKINRSNQVRL